MKPAGAENWGGLRDETPVGQESQPGHAGPSAEADF